MTWEQLQQSGRDLNRAFDLLNRANEYGLPFGAALVTKQGLLQEARQAVEAARATLAH